MKLSRGKLFILASVVFLGGTIPLLPGQNFAPPAVKAPDAVVLKAITEKTERLGQVLGLLRGKTVPDPVLVEIEVFHKAALWIVRHNEFFQPSSAAATLAVLDDGLLRASLASQGDFFSWLAVPGHTVGRAYRSKIDGSVQPYAVTFPADYGKDATKRWRLDVVLHGRDSSLTEVKFLHQYNGRIAPKGQDFVRLDIYGRGNNAYRWAGEIDVFEALENFLAVESVKGRGRLLDSSRRVLRGFSMGGAGSWHLGLQHPSQWCVIGPGAGFTATHGYIKGLPELPPWQEKCLRIYDAVAYAENVFDVPVVAYGGAEDPQLQAARNIETALKGANFEYQLKVLVAPGLAHKFPPEWQKKAEEAYAPFVAKGREEYPQRVRFVTYTLRYARCDWVDIMALDQHYEKALVDALRTETGFALKTANVRTLHLMLPVGSPQTVALTIDGQQLRARPWIQQNGSSHLYLERRGKDWSVVLPQRLITAHAQHLRKVAGLQGPIDDAFMDGFLCVRGTEQPWHEATQKYADANLQRFQQEWSKFWRGDLPVKDDIDLTDEDIASKHLILFGDPASNSLIAQVLDGLPLEWTRKAITLAGKSYSSAEHVPALIYPSPLNATKYVVLNSGHTFHEADYIGTNALLYPRLGDYAVLRLAPTERDPRGVDVATAGLFDDSWQIPKQ